MADLPSIGQFEQLVLTAIVRCGDSAYGVTVHEVVEELSARRSVALGAVYSTLDRLEDKGLISSWLSDPTPERGGRSKRHYRLETNGERALRESVLTARRICETLEHAWGTAIWDRKWKPARQR
jgi:PadR family transcriptional regulator, regulatory protein PadR